nr:AAA family ATPase [Gluconobacter kondonii]
MHSHSQTNSLRAWPLFETGSNTAYGLTRHGSTEYNEKPETIITLSPRKIVVISKLKGGSGATTLTHELATSALTDSKSVAIIDLDAQSSLTNWWNRRTAEKPEAGPRTR